MTTARLMDGKALSARLREHVGVEVQRLKDSTKTVPGLAVILVGDNPASQVYVGNKVRQAKNAGIQSFDHYLPATTKESDVCAIIKQLNEDARVDGILVQLPLPAHICEQNVIAALDPRKDVDGLHPDNAGRLVQGLAGFVPCTPLGCLLLLQAQKTPLQGKNVVILGRSNLVGKPLASLLLGCNCTVTVAHSHTRDIPALARRADILVAAVGKAEFVRGAWVKPGAVVLDVGINALSPLKAGQKRRLVGDVAAKEVAEIASAMTPVPGGVGPMTVACLLYNTLKSFCHSHATEFPLFDIDPS